MLLAGKLDTWAWRPVTAAADLRVACAGLQSNSEDGVRSWMWQAAVATAI